MSYISDHALYGVGNYHHTGLGADDSAQYGSYMQTQMNVAAGYLGLAKITVDGKPGPATLALLQAIYDKTKNVVAQDPVTTIADMKANTKVIGDFVRNNIVPAIKSPSAVTFQPINITGNVPATPKVVTQFRVAPAPYLAPGAHGTSTSFLQKKVIGLPLWLLLVAGGAAALVVMRRGGRKAPAPAATPTVAAVPKGA